MTSKTAQAPTIGVPDDDERLWSYDEAFLVCRGRRHHELTHERDVVTDRRGKTILAFTRHWRCENCAMRRLDRIDARLWMLEGRSYKPPEGYSLAGDAVDPRALRRAFYVRTSAEFEMVNGGLRLKNVPA
jgi:hypothetical protein